MMTIAKEESSGLSISEKIVNKPRRLSCVLIVDGLFALDNNNTKDGIYLDQ
jgi:hypothetical protein